MTDAAHNAYLPRSGTDDYAVIRYDLDLNYRVATNRLDATAVIRARAVVDLTAVVLDLVHLKTKRVRLDGAPARFSQNSPHLRVTPPGPPPPGTQFPVEAAYDG